MSHALNATQQFGSSLPRADRVTPCQLSVARHGLKSVGGTSWAEIWRCPMDGSKTEPVGSRACTYLRAIMSSRSATCCDIFFFFLYLISGKIRDLTALFTVIV